MGLPYRIRAPLSKLQKSKASPRVSVGLPHSAPPNYLQLALTSKSNDHLAETRLDYVPGISERAGSSIHIKREDTNPTFTYYIRGAYNQLAAVKAINKGSVVTGSVGSRGYAVATVARRLGLRASIVMPESTPQPRIENVVREGATVIQKGTTVADSQAEADRLASVDEDTYLLDPHNDPLVIAGHATVGLEILRQHARWRAGEGKLDGVFVNVGGGSLLAGVAAVVKQLSPDTLVVGVEPEGVDVLQRSLMQGHRVTVNDPGLDAVWVRQMGKEVFALCDEHLDDMVTVSDSEIGLALRDYFKETRALLEPAGAVALAGLQKWLAHGGASGSYVAIASDAANAEFEFFEKLAGEGIALRKF